MTIYNAKHNGKGIRITKFTDNLDVESSYTTSRHGCDCPAGHRDTCRHRQMLSVFETSERIGTPWFYDFDNARWFYYDAASGHFMNKPPRPAWRRI